MYNAKNAHGHIIEATRAKHGNYWCLECNKLVHLRNTKEKGTYFYHAIANTNCSLSTKSTNEWSNLNYYLNLLKNVNYKSRWNESIENIFNSESHLHLLDGDDIYHNPVINFLTTNSNKCAHSYGLSLSILYFLQSISLNDNVKSSINHIISLTPKIAHYQNINGLLTLLDKLCRLDRSYSSIYDIPTARAVAVKNYTRYYDDSDNVIITKLKLIGLLIATGRPMKLYQDELKSVSSASKPIKVVWEIFDSLFSSYYEPFLNRRDLHLNALRILKKNNASLDGFIEKLRQIDFTIAKCNNSEVEFHFVYELFVQHFDIQMLRSIPLNEDSNKPRVSYKNPYYKDYYWNDCY